MIDVNCRRNRIGDAAIGPQVIEVRTIRMNEADGGFKRPSDEGSGRNEGGRKRIPMREKRY